MSENKQYIQKDAAYLARRTHELYQSGIVISVDSRFGAPAIQISCDKMLDWAPMEEWKLNIDRSTTEYPYQHELYLDGVRVFTITVEPIQNA